MLTRLQNPHIELRRQIAGDSSAPVPTYISPKKPAEAGNSAGGSADVQTCSDAQLLPVSTWSSRHWFVVVLTHKLSASNPRSRSKRSKTHASRSVCCLNAARRGSSHQGCTGRTATPSRSRLCIVRFVQPALSKNDNATVNANTHFIAPWRWRFPLVFARFRRDFLDLNPRSTPVPMRAGLGRFAKNVAKGGCVDRAYEPLLQQFIPCTRRDALINMWAENKPALR